MHKSSNTAEESSKMITEAEEEILEIIRSRYLEIFRAVDEAEENICVRSTELDSAVKRIYEEFESAG